MASFREKRSIESLDDIYREAIKSSEEAGRSEQIGLSEDFLGGDVYSADGEADGSYGQVIMHSLASHDPAWHGKEVAIAADRMRVTVKVRGGQPLSSYQLNHGLEQLGVSFGVNWPALARLEAQAKSGWQGEMVVALGQPAESRQSVTFPEGIQRVRDLDGSYYWLVEGARLNGGKLREVLAADKLERLERVAMVAKAVAAGTVLATIRQNPGGKPGMNVLGEVIDPVEEPLPGLGDNVLHNQGLGIYEATHYGYLVPEGNSLSVLPPVWLSPDHLNAYYVNFAQIGHPVYPGSADLLTALSALGVREGTIRRGLIDKLSERLAQGQVLSARTVKIAEAISPKAGSSSRFTFHVDMGESAALIRDDGTIDLAGRNAVVPVEAGALLAEKINPTKGIDGVGLFGEKIAAADGGDQTLAVDETIRVEEREGLVRYYARKPGNVRFAAKKLSICDIFHVRGDVDPGGGNLDRREDILIHGSVLAGLSVKSQGNIAITGSVYTGAKVMAGGDITVGEGIAGVETRVVALGNLQAVFVQDAEVIVKGNALIKSSLYNAVLRANGSITVLKGSGQKSGRVIGGVTCASQGITVSSVGHPDQGGTVIAILPNPEYTGQLMRLEEEARSCRENIAKVSRSLPFESFDPATIKRALALMPVEKREAVVKLMTTFNNLIKRQQNVETLKKEINSRIASDQRNAAIRITQGIFQGSEVRFGDKKLEIATDLGPTTFSLQAGEIV